ncbi:hypothetical protein JCM21738_4091 [Mesobacillus boroniphilus JCM 21738]|uniref:Uncharacterized protein n=1 Tax=Mesobacillus boroniphilus JCM 21738 TaxID=1294265 RepID=W4RS50_9BACI|nr:hypothetical protein JCM21738_4091 [Mesobacillus boroniphilus JCM 21738]
MLFSEMGKVEAHCKRIARKSPDSSELNILLGSVSTGVTFALRMLRGQDDESLSI